MTRPIWYLFPLAAACSSAASPDDVARTYADIVEATYVDARRGAQDLAASVDALVADPSETTLADARDAWRASRPAYLESEVFRFYDGPIDDPTDGPEGLLNAWPLDEAYIDHVEGDDDAGIVNDTAVEITADALVGLNEVGGEKNIATGYHAVEFLLWGQDQSVDGPGARPHTEFVEGEGGTAANADRRKAYLSVVADLIVTHVEGLELAWAVGADYRNDFEVGGLDSVEKILAGMIILSGFETGGERLQAALDSGDQEDEHSCFSDNTHIDMIHDVIGVQNVWLGTYATRDGGTVSGTSVRDLVAAADPDLAETVDARIAESVALAQALHTPFDQEIAPGNAEGRARVQALVDSLGTQEDLLFDVFDLLGLSVEIPE